MPVRRTYKHTVLALSVLAFFSTMVARLVISPVVPSIRAEFGVSNGAIGFALTGMWIAYALLHYPGGVLGDRFGERRVILGAITLSGLAGIGLAMVPSFLAFAFLVFVLGATAGIYYPVAVNLLANQFTNTGQALGIHISGAPLAGLVTPIAATYVGIRYGWRSAMLLAAVVALPTATLFAWQVKPPDSPPSGEWSVDLREMANLFSRPVLVYTVVLAFIQSFVWQGSVSFLPTFFVEYHGQSPQVAGLLFSLFFVLIGVSQPILGRVSDRIGRGSAAAGAFSAAIGGYLMLLVGRHLPLFAAGVVLAGIGMSSIVPLESKFVDELSDEERTTGFGILRTMYVLFAASGSVIIGTLADLGGWGVAFSALVVLLTGAVILIGIAGLRRRERPGTG